jgi:hypothetical protein
MVPDQRTQDHVGADDEHGAKRRVTNEAHTSEESDRRGAPEGRGRVEAADVQALLENHAGAEETDARHDLRANARRAVRVARETAEQNKRRRPEGDERIGSQSGETLAPLPLEADRGAEGGGSQKIEAGVDGP